MTSNMMRSYPQSLRIQRILYRLFAFSNLYTHPRLKFEIEKLDLFPRISSESEYCSPQVFQHLPYLGRTPHISQSFPIVACLNINFPLSCA
jgi:hypothetical protein